MKNEQQDTSRKSIDLVKLIIAEFDGMYEAKVLFGNLLKAGWRLKRVEYIYFIE